MTESLDEFFVRMNKLSGSLDKDGKYLMVSHGAICRTLHGMLSGADLEDIRHRYLHDETIDPKTSVRNCSLNWSINGQDVWFSKIVYEDVPDLDINTRKDCS